MIIASKSESETVELGFRIGAGLRGGELILLQGDLGAGKTRMARGIIVGAGAKDEVSSPTFALEHIHEGRMTLLHIDLYRIKGEEISDLGIDDALGKGATVIVEWGEKLPEDYRKISLPILMEYLDEQSRTITIPDGLLEQ